MPLLIEGFVGQEKKRFTDDPWPELYKAMETGEVLQDIVTGIEQTDDKRNQLIVSFGPVKGIIPPDEIGENLNTKASLVGQVIAFKVKACDREAKTVYLSRKDALEEMATKTWSWLQTNAAEVIRIHKEKVVPIKQKLASLEDPKSPEADLLKEELRNVYQESTRHGPKVTGVVRWVTPKGAYLDIGGLIAYLPVTEASWSIQSNCRDILTPGDALDVKIVDIDPETKGVLVSAKALIPDPWETAEAKYRPNGLYYGTVKKVAETYTVVEIEPGIVGLAFRPPFEEIEEGSQVVVKLISLDPAKRRARLTIHKLLQKGA